MAREVENITKEESGIELGDWSLPSRANDSLHLDLDLNSLIAAIKANGELINQKISETQVGARLSKPVSSATLNLKVY